MGRYEQFHETGKPVRQRRSVITSPIYRTFVDEAITGYDIKDDVARDLYVKVVHRVTLGIVKQIQVRTMSYKIVRVRFDLLPYAFFSPILFVISSSWVRLRYLFMNALRISSHRPAIDLSRVSILQNGY